MDNATRLKKMHNRAKAIIKKHPNMQYKTAQKQAGREMREGVSGRGKKKKTVGNKPKYKVYHEVKRIGKKRVAGLTYKGGSVKLGSMSDARAHKSSARKILEERLGWMLLSIHQEKNKTVKKSLLKKKADLVREIKQLS
jgi:hypothetical protein